MIDLPKRITDDQLERYADDLMSAEERLEFETLLAEDADAQKRLEAERLMRDALKSCFVLPSVTAEEVERQITRDLSLDDEDFTATPVRKASRKFLVAATAIAATVVWGVVALNWNKPNLIQPHFEPRPLMTLYRESIEQGFRPYYFCEDEERFAMTFAKRQQVPLKLAMLPDDRRMVGLSYLGGLSRETTAMLAYFQETPVVVFIDRQDVDNSPVISSKVVNDLNIYRHEYGELVFYEVSPLDEPKFLDYLR